MVSADVGTDFVRLCLRFTVALMVHYRGLFHVYFDAPLHLMSAMVAGARVKPLVFFACVSALHTHFLEYDSSANQT